MQQEGKLSRIFIVFKTTIGAYVRLLSAKTRVARLKQLSTPGLEPMSRGEAKENYWRGGAGSRFANNTAGNNTMWPKCFQ